MARSASARQVKLANANPRGLPAVDDMKDLWAVLLQQSGLIQGMHTERMVIPTAGVACNAELPHKAGLPQPLLELSLADLQQPHIQATKFGDSQPAP